MAALTAPRDTKGIGDHVDPVRLSHPIAASTKIYPGAMVALNSGGFCVPATAALGLVICGVYDGSDVLDNSSGANSALTVPVRAGVFKFNSGTVGDAVGQAQVGQYVWAIDDNTVGATDGNGARSLAGKVIGLDTDGGPLVELNLMDTGALVVPQAVVTLPIDFASLAAGNIFAFTPGFAGRIRAIDVIVSKAATTGAKAATLQPRIGGTLITGGVVAMTSANMTPAGAVVAGSAVTALNTFTAAQAIDINVSAVTAFVEGSGAIRLTLN